MNFYFGQVNFSSTGCSRGHQETWLKKTIFSDLEQCVTHHIESNFTVTLINDPKQSSSKRPETIFIDDDYICVSDCHLYNKKQLITQFNLNEDSSNNQIIVRAYAQWGKLFADQLDGKFSFALLDRKNNKLIAARDALGYGNFCYTQIGSQFIFASDLATLLDQPQVQKNINRKRFYQCFNYANNSPDQTYFEHCRYCPPSHVVEHTAGKTTTQDYWQIHKKQFAKNDADESSNTRVFVSLLTQALDNKADKQAPLGLMLSGGFDSSLLAAILAKNDKYKDILSCYSYTFTEHKSCDESNFINKTITQLGLESNLINADSNFVFADLQSRAIIKDFVNLDGYAGLPEMLFKKANQENKQVMVLGHYGDDLFGGNRYVFADLIIQGELIAIVKLIKDAKNKFTALSELLHFGIRPLLPGWLKSLYRKIVARESKDYFSVSDEQINNVDQEPRLLDTKLFHHKNLLKLIYYTNTAEGIYYYRKHLYLAYGLTCVMPFYSKKMIEFFWTLPVQQINKPGEHRYIQILALRSFNLNHVADRKDKTEFIQLFTTGIKKCRTQILDLIEQTTLKEEIKFPKELSDKLKSSLTITDSEAGRISNYVLAAMWWDAVRHSEGSYNQLNKIKIDKLVTVNKCNLWNIES